jgi:hypothetical protein
LNPRRTILVVMLGLSKDVQRLDGVYEVEVVSGASIEELVINLGELPGRGVVAAPKPEIAKEEWFDAVDLRSLREKMTTVMEKTEKALKE